MISAFQLGAVPWPRVETALVALQRLSPGQVRLGLADAETQLERLKSEAFDRHALQQGAEEPSKQLEHSALENLAPTLCVALMPALGSDLAV